MSKPTKELRDQAIAKYRQSGHTEQQLNSYLRGWDMVENKEAKK